MRQTEHRVSASVAKQQLSEILKRVGYGGERYVIEVRGRPLVVISPYRERPKMSVEEHLARIDRMTALQHESGKRTGIQPDSVDLIREAREERDEQLAGN